MAYRRRRSRRFRRSKGTASRALRLARSVSRKMAGEVKKFDTQAQVSQDQFGDFGNRSKATYIDIVDNEVGTSNASFVGNQIRLKYLYLNLRFVLPKDSDVGNGGNRQAMWRVIVVQDTSQVSVPSYSLLINNLFGYGPEANPDLSVLPINPMQPGRFRVIDDSYVRLSDGMNQDYMYRRYFYQRRFASGGRVYYGYQVNTPNVTAGRNHVYALLIYCPVYQRDNDTESYDQNFTVSYMSRMAYYDN